MTIVARRPIRWNWFFSRPVLAGVAERRPSARANPSRGAALAPEAALFGGEIGGEPIEHGEFEPQRLRGGDRAGTERSSPGNGIRTGVPGRDHRISAAVATGRPMVATASPTIPSNNLAELGTPSTANRRWPPPCNHSFTASTAGGLLGGGSGGEEGRRPSGSGGTSGPGSRAAPFGGGEVLSPAYRTRTLASRPTAEAWSPRSSRSGKMHFRVGRARRQTGRAIVSLVIYSDGNVATCVSHGRVASLSSMKMSGSPCCAQRLLGRFRQHSWIIDAVEHHLRHEQSVVR